MHVGLVIYGSLDTVSGGYLYDRKLVERLRAHSHRVTVLSIPWRSYARHLLDNFDPSLRRKLLETKVDLWLQDELNHPSLFLLNQRLKGRMPPVISIVHHLRISERHPFPAMLLYRAVERRYLASVDGFLFNSRTTRGVVASVLGKDPMGAVAYPGGDRFSPEVTPEDVSARAMEPGPLCVLFVGNLIPRKGLHVLLEAIRMLPPGSVLLDVVGSADFDRRYARQVRAMAASLGETVRFCGRLGDDALAALLRRSHLLAVPSQYEGFGIVYLETMGFGMPVIAGTDGAAREFVEEGVTGFLVPPDGAATLAEHLLALHRDRKRLAAMGIAALERYRRHPTWEESMESAVQFLVGAVRR
jgi:glycosyltransferase involved in cell wall biosynthesis